MRYFNIQIISYLVVSFWADVSFAEISPSDLKKATRLLTEAEKIRAPDEGVSYVTLISKNSKKTITYQLEVLLGPGKTSLVEFREPPIERGRRMLMQGSSYFAKFRHSKSAIPISRREAVGNSTFALADIFRLDLDDYDIVAMGKKPQGKEDFLVKLQLKAKNKEVPYEKVFYYVSEKESFPVKAEFYGISGRHLKSLFVEEKKKYNGVLRASKVRMDDVVRTDRKSWWNTKKIVEKKLPKKVFTKDYLVRD